MILIRFGLVLFGVIVLVLPSFAQEPALSLEQRVEAYIAHSGSADHLGPDFERLLVQDLEKAAKRTLDSIRSRIHSVEEFVTLSPQEQKVHVASLRLLVLCCEDGRQLAADQLRRSVSDQLRPTTADGKKPPLNQQDVERKQRTIYSLQTVIIRAMGEVHDARILPTALVLVGKGNRAIRSDVLRYYLEPLIASDLDARGVVKQALVTRDSPVFGDEELGAIVTRVEEQDR